MSYATMDCVQTMEDIANERNQCYDMYDLANELFIHNHVAQYLLLSTPEKRRYFRSQIQDDNIVDQKVLRFINTFDSAELPDPPVKRKRGRPRKVAIG